MCRGWIRNKFCCLFQGSISCHLMKPVGDRLKIKRRQLLFPLCAARLWKPCCRSSRCRKFTLVQKLSKFMERRIHGGAVKYKNTTFISKLHLSGGLKNTWRKYLNLLVLYYLFRSLVLVSCRPRVVSYLNLRSKPSGLFLHKFRALAAIPMLIWPLRSQLPRLMLRLTWGRYLDWCWEEE